MANIWSYTYAWLTGKSFPESPKPGFAVLRHKDKQKLRPAEPQKGRALGEETLGPRWGAWRCVWGGYSHPDLSWLCEARLSSPLLSLWRLMSQFFLRFHKTQLSAKVPIGGTWVTTPIHGNQRDQMLNQLELRKTGRLEREKIENRQECRPWKENLSSSSNLFMSRSPTNISVKQDTFIPETFH